MSKFPNSLSSITQAVFELTMFMDHITSDSEVLGHLQSCLVCMVLWSGLSEWCRRAEWSTN